MNPTEQLTNPALGVMIFMLGGLAGAVFYLPFKKVKNWAWESYWLVYAVVGLILVPWVLAGSTSPNVILVLSSTPKPELLFCFLCGAMWGVGGLTWGLMIRYLGFGLGLAIGAGLTSATGTLIPKAIKGEFGQLFQPGAGITSLAGVIVSLLGIVLVGMAGMSKESELPEEEKKKAVAEFDFKKGILVAIFSGVMSAGMSFGLQGGPMMEHKALYGSGTQIIKGDAQQAPQEFASAANVQYDAKTGYWVAPATAPAEKTTGPNWKGMPVLVVVLLGGFVVNFVWCLLLNAKNKTIGDYGKPSAPLASNFLFAGLAGAIWCTQFICFKTGEPAMGTMSYVGWAVLMASAILFSSLLGIYLGEWKGTSTRTRALLALGLLLLLASSVIVGYSGHLDKQQKSQNQPKIAWVDNLLHMKNISR